MGMANVIALMGLPLSVLMAANIGVSTVNFIALRSRR